MTSRLQFWVVLVALNAAIWIFAYRHRAFSSNPISTSAAAPTNRPFASAQKPVAPIVVRTNAFDWTQLESEDYRTYINRLRSVGCPEETIRDIIIADLEKLMAPEIHQLEGRHEPPKYWEPKRVARTTDTLEKQAHKQEIDFKKREIVRELLGIDLASERARTRGEADFYEERLSFLPADKQMKVRMLIEKANQEETALRESSWLDNDEPTAEDRQKLREIQKGKDSQVAEILAPDELDQYNLWFSPSAYKVRDAFLALEPNEGDFLALYKIQSDFDAKWDGVDPKSLSPAEQVEYQAAQAQYEAQIREHLGPERYAQFQLTREPDFHQLQDTVAQFGLKPEVVGQIYDYKKALTDERQRVTAQNLPPEQKQELLKVLSEETEQAVVETLGPRPYRYYLRTGAGKWIHQ